MSAPCHTKRKIALSKLLFAKDLDAVKDVIKYIINDIYPEYESYDPYEDMSLGDLDDDWGDRG